jgi:hypothetical protein
MSLTLLYNLVVVFKAIAEIAGLALLGQGVLLFLAGPNRDRNVFYAVLAAMTSPVRALARALLPRFVVDQHVGMASFGLVLLIWACLYIAKVYLVLRIASEQLPG